MKKILSILSVTLLLASCTNGNGSTVSKCPSNAEYKIGQKVSIIEYEVNAPLEVPDKNTYIGTVNKITCTTFGNTEYGVLTDPAQVTNSRYQYNNISSADIAPVLP